MRLKTVTVPRGYEGLHIEVPGAIVNIYTHLRDEGGRQVVRVSVDADGDKYAGEPQWWCPDLADNGLDPGGVGIRIVQMDEKPVVQEVGCDGVR
ncbi:MAG: hypothetical protein AMXMBFR13_06720 [Phycisphaerae bacterium]